MSDPFFIDGPAAISFSGGRTSAYMLWRVLLAHGGTLPGDVPVIFANTGKEDEATLRFVRDCGARWGVPIAWLEWRADAPGFAVVDFDTASREGEPFEAAIIKRRYLPNPVTRFCTYELKIRTMARYLVAIGAAETLVEGEGLGIIGIRADEGRRAAKFDKDRIPLWRAGVTVHDVDAFWAGQDFGLELDTFGGRTLAGNCDLCFLKPAAQLLSLIAEKPGRAVWWARMESLEMAGKPDGARFYKDRPGYADMARFAVDQSDMFADDGETGIACFCGD
jgi:3'-phosphoadenosine 5'-phosphosulfate sulfotransferase (PAPS reductase)/FAD synthetase